MSVGFTPGPWRSAGFSSIVGAPVVAQPDKTKNSFNVCGVAGPVSREENIANAHLIAAAPELYEAAEELLSAWTAADDVDREARAVNALGRALRKARGEP